MKEISKIKKEASEAASADAWFAVRLGLGMLAIHYAFGTLAAIAFMAGWLWGIRDRDHPPEDVKLDDLL
jgi:hypothetical protein